MKFHYLLLAPLILSTVPPPALIGLNVLATVILGLSGLAGNLLGKRWLSILTSVSLLFLLVWGRLAVDVLKTRPPDTAVFLIEFGMVIFLMEINLVVLTFDKSSREFRKRNDDLSKTLETRLAAWMRNQLSIQTKIAVGSIGLSLVLLPLAGLTSISTGELPLTGALLLLALIALLFLVTYKREPDRKSKFAGR